jgi:cyclohexa-1,5-dienecarbonyl-CoA hydratase
MTSAASTQTIRYESRDRVARVTLDRPPLNVLDLATIRALDAAVARAANERASVLVVGAAGTQAFSAGVAVQDHAPEKVAETLRAFHSVFRRLYHAPFVSVAKVRGKCLGGGCELALFCDIVVAADCATFGLPEIDLACFPPVALSAFPYRFGRRALELVVTGEPMSADDAWRGGLVSQWTPRDELDEHVDELASHLAAKSAAALALTVQTARRLWSPGFERSLDDAERAYLDGVAPLADHREAMAAFLEKRAPNYER